MFSKNFSFLLLVFLLLCFFTGCTEPPSQLDGDFTAIMTSLSLSPTNEDSMDIQLIFNAEVEGLSHSDFIIVNGAIMELTGSGKLYSLKVQPEADGTVTVTLPADSATALGTETGNPEAFITIVFDRTSPSVPTIEGISDGTFSSAQTFSLSGLEEQADVEYSLNGGTTWNEYFGATVISQIGDYVISAKQTDKAGNISGNTVPVSISIEARYRLTLTILPHGTIEIDSVSYESSDSPCHFDAASGGVIEMSVTGNDFGYDGCTWAGTDSGDIMGTFPNYSIVIDSDKQLTADFDFASNMKFVSKSGNDTTGTGSIEEPYLTIAQAVSDSAAGYSVYISEGSYTETITLTEAVSLYGGYNPLEWGERDIDTYETILNNAAGPALLLNSSSITTDVTIDGFTVIGGIHCNNGAYPIISNNNITGIPGTQTGAIRCIDSGAIIHDNNINGGAGSGNSTTGILFNNSTGEIYNNTISGGSADNTSNAVSLVVSSANIAIHHNYINPGAASLGSNGIEIYQAGNITIYNNVIFGGGSPSENSGVQIQDSPGCIVQNNTIDGGINGSATNYGSRDVNIGEGTVVTNNLIFFTAGATKIGINSNSTAVSYNTVWDCQDPGGYDGTNGNTVNPADPALGGTTGMEPTASSHPVLLSQSGTVIPSITDDVNGNSRTDPYFPGAFEYDG